MTGSATKQSIVTECAVPMDCFASLAMTVDSFVVISRGLRVLAEPGAHAGIGVGVLGDVADDGDRVGAGGENVGGLFKLDAADRDQRDVADALFPLREIFGMPCGAKRIDFSVVGKIGPSAM